MKAIIVAALVTVALAIGVTVAFRLTSRGPSVGLMVKMFGAFVPMLILVWSLTPVDLGFLAPELLADPPWFDLAASLFFYAAAFAGGLLQLYNLADRGLSLRILAELAASTGRALTVEEIASNYSGGRGLAWMYDKRVAGLVAQRLVVADGEALCLTDRGRRWAARCDRLRRFLRLPAP